jgi:hypothetical protein
VGFMVGKVAGGTCSLALWFYAVSIILSLFYTHALSVMLYNVDT